MSNDYMITTVDNPFDPNTHFDDWHAWDVKAGYHTTAFLARVIITSSEISDLDQDQAYKQAVDEIVKYNVLGLYKKAYAKS